MYKKLTIGSFVVVSLLSFAISEGICGRTYPKWFEGRLSISPIPRIGEETTLQIDLMPLFNQIDRVDVIFRLPSGVTSLSTTQFLDQLVSQSSFSQYSVIIRINRKGRYVFQASLYFRLANGREETEHFFAYLLVSRYGSQLGNMPFDTPEREPLTRQYLFFRRRIPGIININGNMTYYDDNIRKLQPIRYLKISLLEANIKGYEEITHTFTDLNGKFVFSGIVNEDPEDASMRDIVIRASFQNDVVGIYENLTILDGVDDLYEFDSDKMINVPDGDIQLAYSLGENHPKRVLGLLFNQTMDIHNFLDGIVGRPVNWGRDYIQVKWPDGQPPSHYHVQWLQNGKITQEYIRIAMEDSWRKTAMVHEYGHAVMVSIYDNNMNHHPKTDLNIPDHKLTTISDLEFAFIEGWAEFMEAAVYDDAFNVVGFKNSEIPNIEFNEWWTGDILGKGFNLKGEIVEGAVASILWDIADIVNSRDEDPGRDDDGINGIFELRDVRIRQIFNLMRREQPQHIIEFVKSWWEIGYGQLPQLIAICRDNGVIMDITPNPLFTAQIIQLSNFRGQDNEVYVGETLTVEAKGFNPEEQIRVIVGNKEADILFGDRKARIDGSLSTTFVIPLVSGGWKSVKVVGETSQQTAVGRTLIRPNITEISGRDKSIKQRLLQHADKQLEAKLFGFRITLQQGDRIVIKGNGFTPGNLHIKVGGEEISMIVISETETMVKEDGTFKVIGIIENIPSGIQDIVVEDASGNNDTIKDAFNVLPPPKVVKSLDKKQMVLGTVTLGKIKRTVLLQNFPNPFNPETWIPYQLSESADVSIRIYDVAGRLVRTLYLGRREAGLYVTKGRAAYWDGRNDAGDYVASGAYFYELVAGNFRSVSKMVVLK